MTVPSIKDFNDVGCELSNGPSDIKQVIDWDTFDFTSKEPLQRKYEVPSPQEIIESFSEPRIFLAPMVDGSEFAYRVLANNRGISCCWTPMIHSRIFSTTQDQQTHIEHPENMIVAESCEDMENSPLYLKNCQVLRKKLDAKYKDSPVVAQFNANDPGHLLNAVKTLETAVFDENGERRKNGLNVVAVELNMGCPQRIARRSYYGSYLQENWSLQFSLIRTVAENCRLPIFGKVRICEFSDDEETNISKTVEYINMLYYAGASMVTLHARYRSQRGTVKGEPRREMWAKIRKQIKNPLIYNGSVDTIEEAVEVRKMTGADGIMVGEGLLFNLDLVSSSGDVNTRINTLIEYLNILISVFEESYDDKLPFIPTYPGEQPSGDSLTDKEARALRLAHRKKFSHKNKKLTDEERGVATLFRGCPLGHIMWILAGEFKYHADLRPFVLEATSNSFKQQKKVIEVLQYRIQNGIKGVTDEELKHKPVTAEQTEA